MFYKNLYKNQPLRKLRRRRKMKKYDIKKKRKKHLMIQMR